MEIPVNTHLSDHQNCSIKLNRKSHLNKYNVHGLNANFYGKVEIRQVNLRRTMMQHMGQVRIDTLRGVEEYDVSAFKGEVIATRKTNSTSVHGRGGGTAGGLPGYQKDIEVSSTTTHYHEIAMRAEDGTEIDFELVNWDFPLRVGEILTMVQAARPMNNSFFFAAVKHNTKDVYVKRNYLRDSFLSHFRVWMNLFLYAFIGFVIGGGMFIFSDNDASWGSLLTILPAAVFFGWKLGVKLTPKFKTAFLRYAFMVPIVVIAIYLLGSVFVIFFGIPYEELFEDTDGSILIVAFILLIIGAIWGYNASMGKAKRAVKKFLADPIVEAVLRP